MGGAGQRQRPSPRLPKSVAQKLLKARGIPHFSLLQGRLQTVRAGLFRFTASLLDLGEIILSGQRVGGPHDVMPGLLGLVLDLVEQVDQAPQHAVRVVLDNIQQGVAGAQALVGPEEIMDF